MNLPDISRIRSLVWLRWALGQAAQGFTYAWWVLFLLELWRPGLIGWYLNLNLLLVLSVVTWLLGSSQVPASTPTKFTYVNPSVSAILVMAVAVSLTKGTSAVWWVPPLALLTVVIVWRVFPHHA